MFAFPSRGTTRLSAGAWRRRITAALAAVTGGVLAWAAAVPAAPAGAVQVITAGGMPGWPITLIAVAAALVAATAAVALDRARASHRAAATG
jgi:hypothetical protein